MNIFLKYVRRVYRRKWNCMKNILCKNGNTVRFFIFRHYKVCIFLQFLYWTDTWRNVTGDINIRTEVSKTCPPFTEPLIYVGIHREPTYIRNVKKIHTYIRNTSNIFAIYIEWRYFIKDVPSLYILLCK